MQEQLNAIFGTDFKVKTIQDGFKITVPSIDSTQLKSLAAILYEEKAHDIDLKRSGTGITVIITTY